MLNIDDELFCLAAPKKKKQKKEINRAGGEKPSMRLMMPTPFAGRKRKCHAPKHKSGHAK